MRLRFGWLIISCVSLLACEQSIWNDPYSDKQLTDNILYLAFPEQPKRLDPATAYMSNEIELISQIYEPVLQYHYLLRPYTLIPSTAMRLPKCQYFDSNDKVLPETANEADIAYSIYEIEIKPGIYYQQHPAFAEDAQGRYVYHQLTEEQLNEVWKLSDFPLTGTRELVAEDYVYQIKRIAAPNTFSPILPLMRQYIFGMDDYANQLTAIFDDKHEYINLNNYAFDGAVAIDRYTYRIKVNGKYPQFLYWLSMHFFAPMPWEADAFYQQPGLSARNISLNWYPVGTGPYQLAENNPNRRMVLERNLNFHGDTYPSEGEPGDAEKGLLARAGQSLPFLDRVVYSLEKESIPRWAKFLQGYYDYLSLNADTFDQALQVDSEGFKLTESLQEKGLKLEMRTGATIYYWGFNMLDPLVGGDSVTANKLRQAISLAINVEEHIAIFLSGLGVVGSGPLPPDLFGYAEQYELAQPLFALTMKQRIAKAKQLLVEAGYPNGRHKNTGEALVIGYDVNLTGSPDDKARFAWFSKQLAQIGIETEVRATQLSRFQQKIRSGDIQMFYWNWVADYPDPENFLFLLYGKEGTVRYGGNNKANYENLEYDRLFKQMKNMESTPARAQVIKQMIDILNKDIPWIWGYYPEVFTISQSWVSPNKPSDMIRNALKYQSIDPVQRAKLREAWNKPITLPLIVLGSGFILLLFPVVIGYYRKQYRK